MHFLTYFFITLTVPFYAWAILNGDEIEWNRHAYIVKILSRGGVDNLTRNCLGTLISPSLVLTSPKCIKEHKNNGPRGMLHDFLVIIARHGDVSGLSPPTVVRQERYMARLVENGNSWALLQIRPLDVDAVCPPDPAPKRIAPLTIHPSLVADKESSTITSRELLDANCFVLGFETVKDATEFGRWSKRGGQRLLRIDIERILLPYDDGTISMVSASEESGERLFRARIQQNITACFDDTGAPLFCELPSIARKNFDDDDDNLYSGSRAVQVGMFQSLGLLDNVEYDPSSIEMCTLAEEMHFTLLNGDADFVQAIQRLAFSEFAKTYMECGFNNAN